MDPKITEKAWEPELEEAILKKWDDEKLYDFKSVSYTHLTLPTICSV